MDLSSEAKAGAQFVPAGTNQHLLAALVEAAAESVNTGLLSGLVKAPGNIPRRSVPIIEHLFPHRTAGNRTTAPAPVPRRFAMATANASESFQ